MKRIVISVLCTVLALAAVSAQDTKETKKKNKVTRTFFVENMECPNCVKKIEKNIAFEKGVTDLQCDLETRTVKITYRADKTTDDKLIAAFKKIDKIAKVLDEDEKPGAKKKDGADRKGG
jgi:copper chaperone CopZ